jgi:hypothetical protein
MGMLRHTLRAANAAGFALTLFFALWFLVLMLALAQVRFRDVAMPMAPAFWLVGGVSLVAMVVLLAVFLVRFMIGGVDLNERAPRLVLFAWTCAGCVFHLSQTLALIRFGGDSFPQVPGWLSGLYWYFTVVGALVFVVLIWVNAEGGREMEEDPDVEVDPG